MSTLKEQQKTAVQILSYRVHALEKSLANCREAGKKLSAMLLDYMNQEAKRPYIRVPKDIKHKGGNGPAAVQARYDVWRILSANGMSDYDIEKECGVNRGSVDYARKNDWKARHFK